MNPTKCALGAIAIGFLVYIGVTFAENKVDNEMFSEVCRYKFVWVGTLIVALFLLSKRMLPKVV